MSPNKTIIISASLALIAVFCMACWFLSVSLRMERLELKLERARLRCACAIASVEHLTLNIAARQTQLEKIFENSTDFLLTLEQIKAYNSRMKTRRVSLPNQTAIGGE